MNITPTSTKDDIIDTACEIIDDKQNKITTLKSQQNILFSLLVITTIWNLLF